jgi:hypothetical protein
MPVEIRELIIKTEVRSVEQINQDKVTLNDLLELKSELLMLCKRMISEQTKKSNFKR